MSNLVALIVIVLVSFAVGVGFLIWMVKRYYWGPTGLPPSERYKPQDLVVETESVGDREI